MSRPSFLRSKHPGTPETLQPTDDSREASLLAQLPAGSNVAVVTMLGSLCPVTLSHVASFVEARSLLLNESSHPRPARLETFAEVLGFVSLNDDFHVARKLRQNGLASLDRASRLHLVQLAVADLPWMGCEAHEGISLARLSQRWPQLRFWEFTMNGADDVVKYRKWAWAGPNRRFLTMGRPGSTAQVLEGMRAAGIDPDDGHFVLGPELQDISSTAARRALAAGDELAVARMLHPDVADWCRRHAPWRCT